MDLELVDIGLINFRNHHKLEVKFTSGVNGIIGETGKGKSSIIEAISFLFTGSLFKDNSKEEAITLGQDSGYVYGNLKVGGKPCYIERHLGMSKVILRYDDKKLNKATEVKALWDSLFQLTPDIFNRVIIAEQGKISLLFNGDQSVREKVFQKIFVVPPTEKLRDLIWKSYVKTTPPETPAEPVEDLRKAKETAQADLNVERVARNQLVTLSDEVLAALRDRVSFLLKCQQDEDNKGLVEASITAAKQQLVTLVAAQASLEEKLGHVSSLVPTYRLAAINELAKKAPYEQRLALEKKLLPADKLSGLALLKDQQVTLLAELENQVAANNTRLGELSVGLKYTKTEIAKLENLVGRSICPTCGGEVAEQANTLQTLRIKYAADQTELVKLQAIDLRPDISQAKRIIADSDTLLASHLRNLEALQQLGDVYFDEAAYTSTTDLLTCYDGLSQELASSKTKIAKEELALAQAGGRKAALAIYDGESSILTELRQVSGQISQDKQDRLKQQQHEVQIGILSNQVNSLGERIDRSIETTNKNMKLRSYMDKLQKVYDVLHVSQFPRKLIMSYADIVNEKVDGYLAMFDFPYRSKVRDNFKVELTNEEGYVLPMISGGQQVITGLCIHFALHELFGQSFPMMIIDEGTTHLGAVNRQDYFSLLSVMREKKKFKQLIVVDHDPNLVDVVDNLIEIK